MSVHFSSATDQWETPQAFFDGLNAEFNFTLDPCCLPETAKCTKFYTPVENGLLQSWGGETVFVNPPYGRTIGQWVKKAYEESRKGTVVVCLLPSRTDTKWWHEYCVKGEIRFIKGRLKFENRALPSWQADGSFKGQSAPFPSAVVIFCERPRRVILESPFSGNVGRNKAYARACLRDCIKRGEAPFASHLLYTQAGVLDDDIPEERMQGIHAGFAWHKVADAAVVYTDYGISKGMQYGIDNAAKLNLPVEYRQLFGTEGML